MSSTLAYSGKRVELRFKDKTLALFIQIISLSSHKDVLIDLTITRC